MNQTRRPEPGPAREYHFPGYFRHRLPNGLSVIIAPVTKLPVVSVVTVVNAGAGGDPSGKEGLAELTAQSLREGTAVRSGVELSLALERLGTSLEAGADWDRSSVSMTVLRDRLRDAFDLYAEALLAPAFRDEDIERLKAERLAERMQILMEPQGLADESFARFTYASGARYGEPMGGRSASIRRITRQDVVDFHARSFMPAGTTVIIAGDIGEDEAFSLVSSRLGEWNGEYVGSGGDVDEPARATCAVEIIPRPDAVQSEVRIGHVGAPRMHPDYFPIVVMNAILGGLFSSRINLNLREQHGYTYGASSYQDWRCQAGPFIVSTAVESKVTSNAVMETLSEIRRMREAEVTADELSLATSYLAGVFPIRYETTAAIASALANMVTFGLPDDYYDTYRARITAVDAKTVLAAAGIHLRPEQMQIVVVGNADVVKEPLEKLALGPVTLGNPSES